MISALFSLIFIFALLWISDKDFREQIKIAIKGSRRKEKRTEKKKLISEPEHKVELMPEPEHKVEKITSKKFDNEPRALKDMNSGDQMLFRQLKDELKKIDIDEEELERESEKSIRENISKMPPGLPGRAQVQWMWEEGGMKDMKTRKLQIDARRWEARKQMYGLMPKDQLPKGVLEYLLDDLYAQASKIYADCH